MRSGRSVSKCNWVYRFLNEAEKVADARDAMDLRHRRRHEIHRRVCSMRGATRVADAQPRKPPVHSAGWVATHTFQCAPAAVVHTVCVRCSAGGAVSPKSGLMRAVSATRRAMKGN
eukprot:SAG11_NODE_27_length_23309_cov_10.579362_20_plen_116_part_00